MANQEHLKLLQQGVDAWNAWRAKEPSVVDLREAKLSQANLFEANLYEANLYQADLSMAKLGAAYLNKANLFYANLDRADLTRASLPSVNLGGANLTGANLTEASLQFVNLKGANLTEATLIGADLSEADLKGANLSGAKLRGANLSRADLWGVNLSEADLRGANLLSAVLVGTDLTGADLTGCHIYGISAWNVKLNERTKQQDLVITGWDEPALTTDNVEVAQFVYLLLRNEKIRDVIDTVTSKVVLILGRFTEERKAILDAIREALRKRNYVPILFDFAVPDGRDITETVSLLARMARFIIADLTDPSSIPKELEAIVPQVAVPVQPLLEGASPPYGMFIDYWKYEWVLPIYRYEGLDQLLAALAEKVIGPAEAKMNAFAERRRSFEAELTKSR